MDVSVIIVSWNTRRILAECVASICAQLTSDSYEIIVVDNASTDDTVQFIETECPQIKLIKNDENLGFAKANNLGIRASCGRYVCLVNSDVIVLEDCIDRLVAFMDDNPRVGMAGPRILNPDQTLQVSCRRFPSVWNNLCQTFGLNYLFPKSPFFSEPFMKYWTHDQIRHVDVLSGCFWMIRRKALDEVGLLDEDFFFYGEDVDWCKRFHDAGWDIVFFPQAEAIHKHAASTKKDPIRFYIELHKADLRYWSKHHGLFGRLMYSGIILIRHTLRMPFFMFQYAIKPSTRQDTRLKLRRSLACVLLLLHRRMSRS